MLRLIFNLISVRFPKSPSLEEIESQIWKRIKKNLSIANSFYIFNLVITIKLAITHDKDERLIEDKVFVR